MHVCSESGGDSGSVTHLLLFVKQFHYEIASKYPTITRSTELNMSFWSRRSWSKVFNLQLRKIFDTVHRSHSFYLSFYQLVINTWVKPRSCRQRRKIWAQISASLTLTQWPASLPSEAGWDTSCQNKNTSRGGVPGKSRVARGARSPSSWRWKWKSYHCAWHDHAWWHAKRAAGKLSAV